MSPVDMPYQRLLVPKSTNFRYILPLKPFMEYGYLTHELYSKQFFSRVDQDTILGCIDEITKFVNLKQVFQPLSTKVWIDLAVYIGAIAVFIIAIFLPSFSIGIRVAIFFAILGVLVIYIGFSNFLMWSKKKVHRRESNQKSIHRISQIPGQDKPATEILQSLDFDWIQFCLFGTVSRIQNGEQNVRANW